MRIWSLVARRIEDGGWTGVCRFDAMLRRVFPEMRSVTLCPKGLGQDDVVITDNHLSLQIPAEAHTIVVHHGCAATHYERDAGWHTENTRRIVDEQKKMFGLPNRIYVAPSAWVAGQFRSEHLLGDGYRPRIIPHWVQAIKPLPKIGKPKIMGDWRDHNKGAQKWQKLAEYCPQWEFAPLNFHNEDDRRKQYGEASLYLCLSLSEGGAYSVCDAEAARLPIVTTNVGNFLEFVDAEIFPWTARGNLGVVSAAIEWKLKCGRRQPSWYEAYAFENWKREWEAALEAALMGQEAAA